MVRRGQAMGDANTNSSQELICLRAKFVKAFPWRHENMSRKGFQRWARTQWTPRINVNDHQYADLHAGRAVPKEVGEAFAGFIAEKGILPAEKCQLSVIGQSVIAPVKEKVARESSGYIGFLLGWTKHFDKLSKPFRVDNAAYCKNEADVRMAARMSMECLAVHDGKNLAGPKALAYGEGVLGRTVNAYADQLVGLWETNDACVMFGTLGRGRWAERIGVNIMIPVTEEFRRCMYARETDDSSITSSDILERSSIVMIQNVAESRSIDRRSDKAARSFAHWHVATYQFARLFLPVEGSKPHLISVAGTREGHRRLLAFGFTSVGVKTVWTDREILEFGPPKETNPGGGDFGAWKKLWAMEGIIRLWQAHIETEQKRFE